MTVTIAVASWSATGSTALALSTRGIATARNLSRTPLRSIQSGGARRTPRCRRTLSGAPYLCARKAARQRRATSLGMSPARVGYLLGRRLRKNSFTFPVTFRLGRRRRMMNATMHRPDDRLMKMKTILFLLLPLVLAAVWLPIDLKAQDFRYTVSDGQATITGYNGPGGDVTIPERIEGLPVAQVGGSAFYGRNSIASITIPDSVTSIGSYAFFACTSLASVAIPSSVTSIGYEAFSRCTSLASVSIPYSVTSIEERTFSNCTSLTGATIPNSVTNIGWAAFGGCTSLINVSIPDSVTTIGPWAFSGCTSLASVTIPASVDNIGLSAFLGCNKLASISVDEGNANYSSLDDVLFNKDRTTLIEYAGGKSGAYVVPNSVTSIGDYAFTGCTNLINVGFPSSLTQIGLAAFEGCTGLTSAIFPDSLTNIGGFTFSGCINLINVGFPSSLTGIGNYAFSYCTGLTSVQIPDRVTFVGHGAFSRCSALSIVATGNGVIEIPAAAFSYCTRLTDIHLGTSVTRIQSGYHPNESKGSPGAFEGCTSLRHVTIPDAVTDIGDYAFLSCTSLTSATIGNGVTNIGNSVFFGCIGLTGINVHALNPAYTSIGGVLFDKAQSVVVLCPEGKTGVYTLPSQVTSIGVAAFINCTQLMGLTMADGVTSIRDFAFRGCTSLTSVTIPDNVTAVGDWAFIDCTSLRSVYFMGNAPAGDFLSQNWDQVTVYYRSGTTGWESTFGGRPAVLWIPEEDLDHDGMTNQQEFMAGTDPSDAQSLLALEGVARPDDLAEDDKTPLPPGQFALYFKSIPGKSYVIQSTEMLGGEWHREATVAAGRATQKRVVLDRPPNKVFYRIQLEAAE